MQLKMRLSQYALLLHHRKTFINARWRLGMGLAGWEVLYQASDGLGILNIQDQVSKSQGRKWTWWSGELVKSSGCLEYKIYESEREAWAKENWKGQIMEDLISQAKRFHLYSGEPLEKNQSYFLGWLTWLCIWNMPEYSKDWSWGKIT